MYKLFTLALVLGTAHAQAQTPADTATTYKHQLGLTASPVLDGFFKNNRSLPLGLLYKRQVRPNQAWRVRGDLLYRYFKQEAPIAENEGRSGEAYIQQDHRFELALGKEYSLAFNDRFSGYAGFEVGGFYSPSKREFEVYEGGYQAIDSNGRPYFTTAVEQGTSSFNAWGILVQPLVGLRYRLNKRLYTEVEATASTRWTRTHFLLESRKTDYATGMLDFGRGSGENIYYSLANSLRPISAIHLVFLF